MNDTPEFPGGRFDEWRRRVADAVHSRRLAQRHRLAQAADAHPTPVFLETGHFAPPNDAAVWHLPTKAGNVVQIIAHNDGAEVGMRILPMGEA